MPRPPAVPTDNIVDAEVCARAGSSIVRHYNAADLPRLGEAGGSDGTSIEVNFQFAQFESRPTVTGEVHGAVVLTCQRCMQPVAIDVDDHFQVLIVTEEREDEPGGYEPVVANATRLDLRWVGEEQVLLALPLVPMHDDVHCIEKVGVQLVGAADESDETEESDAEAEVPQNPLPTRRVLW